MGWRRRMAAGMAAAGLALSGCGDVYTMSVIRKPVASMPLMDTILIYGVHSDTANPEGLLLDMTFTRYSLKRQKWDNGCYFHNFTRQLDPKTFKAGETRYYAHKGASGAYGEDPNGKSVRVYETPAGKAVYVGTFTVRSGVPGAERTVDMEAATAFARSLNLPAPVEAQPRTMPNEGSWGCSETASTFG